MRIAIHRLAAIAAAFSLPLLLAACGGNKSAIDQATAGLPSGATVVNGIAVPERAGAAITDEDRIEILARSAAELVIVDVRV